MKKSLYIILSLSLIALTASPETTFAGWRSALNSFTFSKWSESFPSFSLSKASFTGAGFMTIFLGRWFYNAHKIQKAQEQLKKAQSEAQAKLIGARSEAYRYLMTRYSFENLVTEIKTDFEAKSRDKGVVMNEIDYTDLRQVADGEYMNIYNGNVFNKYDRLRQYEEEYATALNNDQELSTLKNELKKIIEKKQKHEDDYAWKMAAFRKAHVDCAGLMCKKDDNEISPDALHSKVAELFGNSRLKP